MQYSTSLLRVRSQRLLGGRLWFIMVNDVCIRHVTSVSLRGPSQKVSKRVRSRGGLAVHACRREAEQREEQGSHNTGTATVAGGGGVVCNVCGRTFRRPGDLKRHKCVQERQKPVQDQRGAVQCVLCNRWLRSAGGLALHLRAHNPQQSWWGILCTLLWRDAWPYGAVYRQDRTGRYMLHLWSACSYSALDTFWGIQPRLKFYVCSV